MSWHQHFLGPPKIQNCLFLLPASILAKNFNLGIHHCSNSMVFSLFLKTAYMLLCVQIQKVQITISCSNFNTELHKGEISVHLNPSQFAKNAPECPVLENFPLVRPSRTLLTTTPHDISTPENKDTPLFDCIVFLWLAVLVSRKLLLVFVPCLIKNNIEVSLQVKNIIH